MRHFHLLRPRQHQVTRQDIVSVRAIAPGPSGSMAQVLEDLVRDGAL